MNDLCAMSFVILTIMLVMLLLPRNDSMCKASLVGGISGIGNSIHNKYQYDDDSYPISQGIQLS